MNFVSIAILAVVAALVALALRAAFRRDRSACSCSGCSRKQDCPYCTGKQ